MRRAVRCVFFLALLGVAAPARAGYTVVQSKVCLGIGQGVTLPCAFTSPTTASNAIVTVTFAYGIQYPSCTVQDSQFNVYHNGGQQVHVPFASPQISMWASWVIPGGAVTVNTTCNADDYPSAQIFEVNGTFTNAVDQNTGQDSTGVSNGTGSITTTLPNEIIFTAGLYVKNFTSVCASSWSDAGGWTPELDTCDHQDGSTFLSGHTAIQVVTSTGTYSNTIAASGLANPGTAFLTMISSFSFGSTGGATGAGKKRQPFIVKHQKKNPAKPAILVAAK